MDANTKKMTGIAASAAAVAVAASIATTKIMTPEPLPPPPVVVRTVQVDRATGSAVSVPNESVIYDGNLELPNGATCTVDKSQSTHTAHCTLPSPPGTPPRAVFCQGNAHGWGCKVDQQAKQ